MNLEPKDVMTRNRSEHKGGFGGSMGGEGAPKHGGDGRYMMYGLLLVACAVVAVLVAADYWSNSGKIYRGVSLGSVPLGGKTLEEARDAVEERMASDLREIRFVGGPEEVPVAAKKVGVRYDVERTVEEAYAVGREGSILARLGDRLLAVLGVATVSPDVSYEPGALETGVEEVATRVNGEPRDASVSVAGSKVEVSGSREGYELDATATAANVRRALNDVTGEVEVAGRKLEPKVSPASAEEAAREARRAMDGPVVLTAGDQKWTLSPTEVGQTLSFSPEGGELRVGLDKERLKGVLSEVYGALTVEPVEAGYEMDGAGVTVTESRTGKEIDEAKLFDALSSGLFEGRREYEAPVAAAEPKLTTEKAQELKPTALLGKYRTDYRLTSDKSAERVENLDLASGAIDGNLLAPGEVFSMNDTVSGLDYNETKVIVEGKETVADGGGLCQVTSTLYMAANYAGLDVVERTPHYAQLPYIRSGLDATVWFGSIDMKFENTTDGYVMLREYVADDGYIYAEVWGQPTGRKVEMDSKRVFLSPDSATWVTYQKVTEDGEVLFDGVLHKDTYYALESEDGEEIPMDAFEPAPVNP